MNCLTCRTGSRWWREDGSCPTCDGNPGVASSGREDWVPWSRARMVAMFGPRQDGDDELLTRYKDELTARHCI